MQSRPGSGRACCVLGGLQPPTSGPAVSGPWALAAPVPGWLDATPFASWVLPGVALLALVAVPQAAAVVLVARDRPDADRWAMWVGIALTGWIVVQVAILGRFFFLQPVIFTFGAVEAGLAILRRRP